jgi:hypothetical protein
MNDDEPYHFFPLDLTYVNQGAHNQEINHLVNLIFDHNDDNDNESPILSLLFTHPILLLFTEWRKLIQFYVCKHVDMS